MADYPDTTREQLEALTAAAKADDAPVVMLNLLRFNGEEGRTSYARYGEALVPLLQAVGGEVVWFGSCGDAVIGPQEGEWDAVLLVRYPSRQAFLDMIAGEEYRRDAHPLRVAAIADSRLIPCTQSEGALA